MQELKKEKTIYKGGGKECDLVVVDSKMDTIVFIKSHSDNHHQN